MTEIKLNDLLYRAKSDLRQSKYAFGGDEYDLCIAGYHIQQCIEKCIKVCLEELGIEYSKTHRIQGLLDLLPEDQNIFNEEILEKLYDKSSNLNEWEANTRYTKDYFLNRKYVEKVFSIAESCVGLVESFLINSYKEAERQSTDEPRKGTVKKLDLFSE